MAKKENAKNKMEQGESFRAWRAYRDRGEAVEESAGELKEFLSRCKTEREVVLWLEKKLAKAGFKSLKDCTALKPGDRVYMNWKGRGFAAYQAGKKSVEAGFRLIGSHADSPRVDLKCKPLYEEGNLLMADTQYYGGIKKYHWTNIPLALHGEIHKKNGSIQRVVIGEKEDEPLLLIPDLAPHLDRKIAERKASNTIEGENLDAIFAHRPDLEKEKKAILSLFLRWMKEEWGVEERELVSADLSLVPAGAARDAGLDGSLIASYALDDRVCVWASYRALLNLPPNLEQGSFLLVTDREEIGSDGLCGAQGSWIELFVLELLEKQGCANAALGMRRAFGSSQALSADVTEAGNPLYKEAFDPHQMPLAGNGVCFMKYSGSGGKYGASEARGEFLAEAISRLDERKVPWQVGSLGKVDGGGGGTIASFLANLGMDVVDCGPAVLSLHAPWEMVSKADVLSTYEAYLAFWKG